METIAQIPGGAARVWNAMSASPDLAMQMIGKTAQAFGMPTLGSGVSAVGDVMEMGARESRAPDYLKALAAYQTGKADEGMLRTLMLGPPRSPAAIALNLGGDLATGAGGLRQAMAPPPLPKLPPLAAPPPQRAASPAPVFPQSGGGGGYEEMARMLIGRPLPPLPSSEQEFLERLRRVLGR